MTPGSTLENIADGIGADAELRAQLSHRDPLLGIAAAERLAAAVENFLTADEIGEALDELRDALFSFRRVKAGDGHDPGQG